MTRVPRRSVASVLTSLEDEFSAVAAAFADGKYSLWLGSGISREVVPDVDELLRRVLSFLQLQIDPMNGDCQFRSAIEEIFDVAGVPDTLRDPIDLAQPIEDWPSLQQLIVWLRDKYATVLDVRVDGEEPDYLVWTGIEVASTYGGPDLRPDVEHLCVAILMLEGVVRFAPTSNWDGLVEIAASQLAARPESLLKVVVLPEDFTLPDKQAELVKFHGCAVRALADETRHRPRIVAREVQISGWASKPENRMMKERLESVLSSMPALIVGLSAQDENIHTIFNQASQNLVRVWPTDPPAMVCATERLGRHHKHMLKVVYGDSGYSANRDEIDDSALLGAYAKPTLLALVLYVLSHKLCMLLERVTDLTLPGSEIGRLQDDIRSLCDVVGASADADVRGFTEKLIAMMRLVLSTFRSGNGPAVDAEHYEPLMVKPAAEALDDPNFPGDALGRLALAVSLLGRGHLVKDWVVRLEWVPDPGQAAVRIASKAGRTSDVFIVKDAGVLSKLEARQLVDTTSSDVLIICAEAIPARATRSPRARHGRTGRSGAREVDMAELGAVATTVDELFESFKLEGAL